MGMSRSRGDRIYSFDLVAEIQNSNDMVDTLSEFNGSIYLQACCSGGCL
jgi:hypothetical protein